MVLPRPGTSRPLQFSFCIRAEPASPWPAGRDPGVVGRTHERAHRWAPVRATHPSAPGLERPEAVHPLEHTSLETTRLPLTNMITRSRGGCHSRVSRFAWIIGKGGKRPSSIAQRISPPEQSLAQPPGAEAPETPRTGLLLLLGGRPL